MDNTPNASTEVEYESNQTNSVYPVDTVRNNAQITSSYQCFGNNGAKPSQYQYRAQQAVSDDSHSSYPNSRYSTASSTQYSSLGRNAALSTGTTQTQLSSVAGNVPIISGQIVRGGTYSKDGNGGISAENNDCFLLTAQPVRVESNSSSNSANGGANSNGTETATTNSNTNSMCASFDSANSLYNSLISSHSSTDTIGDIVWPSMHSSIDSQSAAYFNLQSALNRFNQESQSLAVSNPHNLTDEGTEYRNKEIYF